MRYRLMATYLGVPYHVGLGPDGNQATLFSPAPPPDELGFTAVGGHWRKQVLVADLDALWQSRVVGEYRDEPCLVLDDLGDRLHIAYLGRDAVEARQLGYWEIDREVFEVVVARPDVTGLIEERVDYPLASAMFPPSNRHPAAQARMQQAGRGASGPQSAEPPVAAPGRRVGRRGRVPQSVFAELLTRAAIPHAAYSVDEDVPGAMCLVKADGGFEVFSRTDDARLDVRFFEDEEAAYFYLFGVLAAEAVLSGRLRPGTANGYANGSRRPGALSIPREDISKYLRAWKLPKSSSQPVIVN